MSPPFAEDFKFIFTGPLLTLQGGSAACSISTPSTYIYYALWESACFLCATTRFSPQLTQFRRSWSTGTMLVYQSRGFVFEPVHMRQFFHKHFEAEDFHFFGTMRLPLFGFVRLFFESLMSPNGSSLQFFQNFQQSEC